MTIYCDVHAPGGLLVEPARSVTLGDVGHWFKDKLPSNRPEQGGTLRKRGYWEKGGAKGVEPSLDIKTEVEQPSTSTSLPEPQHLITSHQRGRRSGTGGSDRLMDWNTPKNLSEALPNPGPLPKGNAPTNHTPPTAQRRWNDFSSLRTGKKRDRKMTGDHIETEKDKTKAGTVHTSKAQPTTTTMEETPSLLEVLEATRRHRRRARRERESLRESGDYLGVQGINPQTGVLDVTSDSGESAMSARTEQRLKQLKTQVRNASSAAERKEAENEIIKIHLDHDATKLRRRERAEKQLAALITGKWRRGTHQWSSIQEPDLSPIAQSQRSVSLLSSQYNRTPPSCNVC
ncbi:hypothetical protein ACHAPJ_001373 [Fusarium lateritium]